MTEKTLRFKCDYCGQETTVIVTTTPNLTMSPTQMVNLTRYCANTGCGQPNKVSVPAYWNTRRLVLGRDKGFLDYHDDIPTFQGEKLS